MKIKARELEGAALDWAVALTQGWQPDPNRPASEGQMIRQGKDDRSGVELIEELPYSTDWSQGGPLVEQNDVTLSPNIGDQYGEHERWHALVPTSATSGRSAMGPTPLVAAMRALVFATLGDEVEIPDELAPS